MLILFFYMEELTMKLNDYQLYEIDGELYSLNELRAFIEIATKKQDD